MAKLFACLVPDLNTYHFFFHLPPINSLLNDKKPLKDAPSTVLRKYFMYRIVASSSPSSIEAHAGLFRLLMQGIFDAHVLCLFGKKDFLISNVS